MTTLRQAAQAVVERWDAPAWKDEPATAVYIAALRKALEAPEQEPVGVIQHLDELNAEWTKHLPIGTNLYAAPVEAPDIKALTKERDEYRATAEELVPSLLEQVRNQQAEITRLQYEVDAIPAIKAERDALMVAGKIALEALQKLWAVGDHAGAIANPAITALKQAGVQ